MPIYRDELYKLTLYNSGHFGHRSVFCDLLVLSNRPRFSKQIYLASVIGSENDCKQISWLMNESKNGRIRSSNTYEKKEDDIRLNVHAHTRKSRYKEFTQKMNELTHMLLVDKAAEPNNKERLQWLSEEMKRISEDQPPRRLPGDLAELILAWEGDIDNQIYKVLMDRYNTPMLDEPDWKEYILEELREREYIEDLTVYSFGHETPLEAALLKLTEFQLEEIITQGIQDLEIEFSIEKDDTVDPVLNQCEGLEDYLYHFAGELGKRIQENIHVRFDPAKDKHSKAFYDVNMHANKQGLTGLFPPQADTVMGMANTINEDNYCFSIGEMGVGKTIIGAVTPYIAEAESNQGKVKPYRVILYVPSIMVEKWKREIKERIPGVKVYEISSWKDVLKLQNEPYRPKQIEYYVMNSDLPKYTYPIEPIEDWRIGEEDVQVKDYEIIPEDKKREVARMIDDIDESGKTRMRKVCKLDEEGKPIDSLIETNFEGKPALKETGEVITRIDGYGNEYQEKIGERIYNQYATDQYPWKETQKKKVSMINAPDFGDRIRFQKEEIYNASSGEYDVVIRPPETGMHCPKCGKPLRTKDEDIAGRYFFKKRRNGKWMPSQTKANYQCTNLVKTKDLPKHEIKEWVYNQNQERYVPKYEEQECGYILWKNEHLPLHSKKRKVSPAWLINKKLRRGFFKYLIADEVHEYKSGDSSIAGAFGQLINHTEKQILLTGTLIGGKASDIFYLLARLDPKRLLKEGIGYKNVTTFINRYGVNDRKIVNSRVKGSNQQPGISPNVFAPYLMPNCAFLELADLGYALPPYQEIPIEVDMTEEQLRAYRSCDQQMKNYMREGLEAGGMGFISTYIQSLYQYADMPFNTERITMEDERGNTHILARPDNFDINEFTPPKLTALCEILDDEIYNHNRKVLVYAKNTGAKARNPVDAYLYDQLKDRGYKVGILRANGTYDGIRMPKNSKKREQWLKDMMAKHDWDVLITNPRLVKVGLDLLEFPNIVYYQMSYNTYEYMQSSRRSWRIKQTKPVRVYTLVYRNTIQAQVLNHMAKKIDAAMAMQGKFSEEGLRAMSDSSSGMNALAKKLLNEGVLDEVETLSDRFKRLNMSYEEMQNATYEDYEYYETNPLGIEEVRKIAQGTIERMEKDVEAGLVSREALDEFIGKMDEVIKQADIKEVNKGVPKKKRAAEGQLQLDFF